LAAPVLRTIDARIALCVVVAVLTAADLHYVVAAQWPDAEAWRIARRAKYVADGAAHALLLAVVLYLSQQVMRGRALIVCAVAVLYGAAHGVMQAACGYAAYFMDRPAVRAAGGLCERANGWELMVMCVVVSIAIALVWRRQHGRR
jgi:hypothetical protein